MEAICLEDTHAASLQILCFILCFRYGALYDNCLQSVTI